ncbi:hypothetical protein ABZ805_19255 [Saccharopolyspora sp. NPDC047091]|uniref:type II toxin-antitoxin system VapC family toxin n=1 Tax=Saccharopolyspora sp. NPDC047091 TaxID=3155924 RepID=UPI0033FF3B1A
MARPRIAAGGTLLLDAAAVRELAAGGARVRAHVEIARARRAQVVITAVTLAEAMLGSGADPELSAVLDRIKVLPVRPEDARLGGKCTTGGAAGHRFNSTVDAIVAAAASGLARPVVLLAADPVGMRHLLSELGTPAAGDDERAPADPGGDLGPTVDSPACEEIAPRAAGRRGIAVVQV